MVTQKVVLEHDAVEDVFLGQRRHLAHVADLDAIAGHDGGVCPDGAPRDHGFRLLAHRSNIHGPGFGVKVPLGCSLCFRMRTSERPRFEQFFALRRTYFLNNLAFSPDSRHISYVHDGSGQFNLWSSPVEGGFPRQLTTQDENAVRHHRWTPSGIVLELDHQGAEQWQLNTLPADGVGWPRAVTDRDDVQYQIGPVADDGRRLLFSGNQERQADMSVYLLDIAGGERTLVLDGDKRQFYPGVWHPDGNRAVILDVLGNTDQHACLFDIAGGELRDLTPHADEEVHQPVGFSADR